MAGPTRVLLIEDDPGVVETVCDGLGSRGFSVQYASDLATGRELLLASPPEIVILDITLPDGNGLDLAFHLRAGGNDVPILVLTARDTVPERITGFRHGADDYLCKPFDLEELAARAHAILRRAGAAERHLLQYADVRLNLLGRTVERGDRKASLSNRETQLLAYLMGHAEEVLSRDRLLEGVWGDEAEEDSNVVNVYVNYLRNKLESATEGRLIHTIRGVGYMLSERDPGEPA